ncbi:MAG: sigma-54-dependent Fis family transcriptional regulator [Saprospiraceae bacterium]|nr:sigma-54-dependent Fis family transcriptional regulator [Saprospiraceae bacterium]
MKKILLSWYATNNDFLKDQPNQINPDGPTASFHRYFYDKEAYEKHIILTSYKEPDDDLKLLHLRTYLQKTFRSHQLETRGMAIQDVINLEEIRNKIEGLLEELSQDQIDLFISPGTPAMYTAWILVHTSRGLNTRLLQTRSAKDARAEEPQLIEVEVEKNSIASSLTILEANQSKKVVEKDYLFTPSIKKLYDKARKVAASPNSKILILGPSGSGKEHLARYIHDHSIRKEQPYKPVNCSAFTDSLLRSELFGHEKGSFTGADQKKIGVIQEADGGTVFLDEIGDISPFMQQVLLRVIQQGEIQPVGSNKIIKVYVRFIAATNADLIQKCESGEFRWDLFYRISGIELQVPSLAARGRDELKEYLDFFFEQKAKELRQPIPKISKELKNILLSYSYPGNIRELQNIVERLIVLAEDGVANISDLPTRILHPPLEDSLLWKDVEKSHIQKVLQKNNYNQNRTCDDIGYGSINTLRKKIEEYGIEVVKE